MAEEVLSAFLTIFIQPLEQPIGASARAAAMSITLAGLEGIVTLVTNGVTSALEFSSSALALILVWMAVTSVLSSATNRTLRLARNLSVLAFWIAATMALVLAAEFLFPSDLDRDVRIWSCIAALMVLVPCHLVRSRYGWESVWMTVVLWLSTGMLAYRAIY